MTVQILLQVSSDQRIFSRVSAIEQIRTVTLNIDLYSVIQYCILHPAKEQFSQNNMPGDKIKFFTWPLHLLGPVVKCWGNTCNMCTTADFTKTRNQ